MSFLPENISIYAELMTSEESPLLKKINSDTQEQVHQPHMISGHLQGRVLSFLSKMIQPKNILEIGTYTGYSALCLAEGLDSAGKLYTIDRNLELKQRVARYFSESEFSNQLIQLVGDAREIIPQLNVQFDLVFIDADKRSYPIYFDLLIEKMKSGAILVADNVLYHGDVLLPSEERDKFAEAIHQFNLKVKADSRVEQVFLPIRDGLLIIRKK